MAYRCANCGSRNTLAAVNNFSCLDCGKLSDFEGNTVDSGIDATGREVIERRLEPRQTNIVGNLADLQRGAGGVAAGQASSVADGVELPALVSEEDAAAPAKAEAQAAKPAKAAKKK